MALRLISWRGFAICLPVLLLGSCLVSSHAPARAAQDAVTTRPEQAPPAPASAADVSEDPESEVDLLGPNTACYVCHITFVKEEFAKVHLENKITCVKCHGLSDKHANDENIGATKPDITFKRTAIDASCDKCHKVHDVAAGEVITRFMERQLADKGPLVCIDCHGTHKIQEADRAVQSLGTVGN